MTAIPVPVTNFIRASKAGAPDPWPGHKPHPRTRDGAVNSLVSTGEAVGEPESRGTTFASRRPLGVEGKPGPAFGLQSATGESRGPQAAR
jgi:hypothetical protein